MVREKSEPVKPSSSVFVESSALIFGRFPFPTFAVDSVRIEPLRYEGGGNGKYPDESPFLFRVFHQFADDERCQDAGSTHPMADFVRRPVAGMPVA